MKNIINKESIFKVFKYLLMVIYLIITISIICICVYSNYLAEYILAKTIPLSITLVSIPFIFKALEAESKDGD